jgi:hypothetical protein
MRDDPDRAQFGVTLHQRLHLQIEALPDDQLPPITREDSDMCVVPVPWVNDAGICAVVNHWN